MPDTELQQYVRAVLSDDTATETALYARWTALAARHGLSGRDRLGRFCDPLRPLRDATTELLIAEGKR